MSDNEDGFYQAYLKEIDTLSDNEKLDRLFAASNKELLWLKELILAVEEENNE